MEKRNEKKVLLLSALGVITLILVVVGATYAYFTAQGGSAVNTNVNVQTNTTDNLSFQVGGAINITANQEDFASGMGNKTGSTTASATLTANNATNTATRNYYLYLDITNNDFEYTTDEQTAELILTITDPKGTPVTELSNYEYVTVGDVKGFDITTTNGLITLADNYEITSTGTETQTWNVTITFVNLNSDQNANTGKNFNATLKIQEELIPTKVADVCASGDNLASCIAEFNTLAGDGVDNLYYHDGVGSYINADQEAEDNSYRYAGANPNNYVCFGSNESSCAEDNLYRIIGVFNGQVKLIKLTSYGSYVWDNGEDNTWNESVKPDIFSTLNTQYYNTINNDWKNIISEHTWQVGGVMQNNSYNAKQFYDAEIGIGQTGYKETMKIGLIYVSDYSFAASSDRWLFKLISSYSSVENNWLANYIGWTISRMADNTFDSYFSFGNHINGFGSVGIMADIYPVFYLSANVELKGGSGTSSDPYILNVG